MRFIYIGIKNLRIGSRLALGFGLLLAMMMMAILVAVLQFVAIGEANDRIDRNWATAEAANLINATTQANARHTMALLIATDPAQLVRINATIKSSKKIVDEAIATLERLVYLPDGKAILGRIKERRSQFLASFSRVRELLAAGQREAAMQVMNAETLPTIGALEAPILALCALEKQIVSVSVAKSSERIDAARTLMLILACSGLLAGVLAMRCISRSITVPIGQALNLVRQVAAGDLTGQIHVHSRDEVGRLLEALQVMTVQLGAEIDQRQRAQEALRLSESMMQVRNAQASRLEAVGTMAAGIAHDFNTILGTISGYAELLGDELADNPGALDSAREIGCASFRARDLIARLLAFARQRPVEPVPMNVLEAITGALKMIRVTLPISVEIVFESDLVCASMLADFMQIEQIVMNLCMNAADAMAGRGRIEVGLRHAPGTRTRFCLVVADNGCGMPPEVLRRVFDPFYTTKEPGKGSGLGLSVVHGIVSDLDGKISLESTPGVGSRFVIDLPLSVTARV